MLVDLIDGCTIEEAKEVLHEVHSPEQLAQLLKSGAGAEESEEIHNSRIRTMAKSAATMQPQAATIKRLFQKKKDKDKPKYKDKTGPQTETPEE